LQAIRAERSNDGDAASRVYVAPGKYDEFYNIVSGGFNGQIGVYGLPSGRLFKIIPVYSRFPENGYGYSEESKPMLNTSNGFVPWDDLHHISLSTTNGEHDGRWAFANGNNTPRVARVDLKRSRQLKSLKYQTAVAITLLHTSPKIRNTLWQSTRFSVPIGNNLDVPISSFKENFKGTSAL
jgi:nitrous-oxide reductase